MALVNRTYDRQKAVAYAHRWAYNRNPAFYDYSGIGGDCTNFTSQCIYAGAGVMNYTPTFGWYYIDPNNKSPSWTGVPYIYNFMVTNEGPGPYGRLADISQVLPGDFVQLGNASGAFYHTPFIVAKRGNRPQDILVAAHSNDVDYKPLNTYYMASSFRFVHIEGVRVETGTEEREEL